LKRNSDVSSAGYLIQAQNAAANTNLFAVDATGAITTASVNSTSVVDGSIANGDLANSSITVTAGSGLSGGGSVSLGGTVTLTNGGVTSLTGTSNQVNVSASTGSVTLSLPQDIHTGASPTFSTLTLAGANALTLGTASTNNGAIIFKNATNSNTTTLQSGAATGNIAFTLPTNTGSSNQVLVTDGSGVLSWLTASSACGSCLIQAPTTTAKNTITPTTNSVVALTVNGTSGTATQAEIINQSGAADALNINLTNTSGTQTNAIQINRNGTGGTTTNGLNITQTAGTLTNGITLGGTIGTGINFSGSNFTNLITATNFNVSNAGVISAITGISTSGGYTQTGTTANAFTGTSTFSNATYSALFTGGNVGIGTATPTANKLQIASGNVGVDSTYGLDTNAATGTLAIGATNATNVNIGNATSATNVTLKVGSTGNFKLQRNSLAVDCSGGTNGGKLTTDSSGNIVCGNDSGGTSAVTSVSNADGTLTISPTTGAVVASLNLGNANTWTNTQTFAAGSSDVSSVIVSQNSHVSPTADIFAVTDSTGITGKYFSIDSSGVGIFEQDVTVNGTSGVTLAGAAAPLTFSGSGVHTISASSGTLRINAFTLNGTITGQGNTISNIGNITANAAANTITGFGTMGTSGTTNFAGKTLGLSASAPTSTLLTTSFSGGTTTDNVAGIWSTVTTATGAGVNNSAIKASIGNAPADASDVINGLEVVGTAQTTASSTQNLVLLTPPASGDTAGTLVGLNIAGITTAGAATETAISVGSNWDNVLTVGGTSIINSTGVIQSAGLSGTYSNALTLSSSSNSITAGTLTATGGTINGTTIGASTASTGAFTTLSTSGNTDIGALSAGGLVKAAVTTGRLSIASAGTDYENPLTFGNGLTRTTNAVALGGTLTANTTLANGGFNLNITGTGNVGIGTGTPTANKLQIASGNVGVDTTYGLDTNAATGTLNIGATNATNVNIGNSTSATNVTLKVGTTGNFILQRNSAAVDCSGGTNGGKLTTDSSGNIVCGNDTSSSTAWSSLTDPAADLSLGMSTYKTTFNWLTGTSTNNLFNLTTANSSNGTGYLLNVATGTSSTVKPFHVSAAGTEALMVDASGRVGIGNTGPTYKLDVSTGAYGTRVQTSDNTKPALALDDTGNTGQVEFYVTSNAGADKLLLDPNSLFQVTHSGSDYLYIPTTGTADAFVSLLDASGTNKFKVRDSGSATAFSVDSAGNGYFKGKLGVAVSPSSYQFEVSGTSNLNGATTVGGLLTLNTAGITGGGLSTDCSASGSKLLWNSSTHQFSCGTDRASVSTQKSSDQTTTSTSLADVTDMSWTVGNSGETWAFTLYVRALQSGTANSSKNMKWLMTGPTGSTCTYFVQSIYSTDIGSGTDCSTAITNETNENGDQMFMIDGTITIPSSPSSNTVKLRFAQAVTDLSNPFKIYGNGTFLLAYKLTGADLAEIYYSKDLGLQPGTIVQVDEDMPPAGVKKTSGEYSKKALGIVSTKPGQVLGDANVQRDPLSKSVLLALSGRIPLRVSTLNGPIKAGDMITTSSIPGIGMKATHAGQVVAKALEDFDPANGKGVLLPCDDGSNSQCGVIMAFANLTYYDPQDTFASMKLDQDGHLVVGDSVVATQAETAQLTSALTTTTSSISSIDSRVTTLEDKYASLEAEIAHGSVTPTATASADIQSLLSIVNDNTHRITSLEDKVASLEAEASRSATLNDILGASSSAQLIGSNSAVLSNLIVTGNTNVNNLAVIGDFTQGLLRMNGLETINGITGVAINTVAAPLRLQSTATASIELQAGTVKIDPTGTISLQTGDIILQQGKIIGNANIRGTENLAAGQMSIVVHKSWDTAPTTITATAGYDSYVWIDSVTADGFTIHVKTAPTATAKIYWNAIW
jgi:hypothetical protein